MRRRRFLLLRWLLSSSFDITLRLRIGGRVVDILSLANACAKDGNMAGLNYQYYLIIFFFLEPTLSHDLTHRY